MTSTDTLLPCPFCGGEARISRAHQNKMLAMGEVPTDEHYLFTLYHDCANGITICWTYKPKDALIAAWNRRTPPTPATEEREAVAQWCSGCHEVRSVDCYRAGCPKSDTERRAAEILAAEANERARALGQAAEHINRLEAALRGLLSTVERLDISEGVCCCGDDMATHAEPMSCGHTPVDAGHYHHGNAIQQARDAIEHGAGK